MRPLSRRRLLQGALAGALAGSRLPSAFAQEVPAQRSALLVVFTPGGYNSLFPSAGSFVGRSFGVTAQNVIDLGNDQIVANNFASLPPFALQHMASVGVRHGISDHIAGQRAAFSFNGASAPLALAAAMGGNASIKCAVVGGSMPPGPQAAVNGVSYQQIRDVGSTLAALGGTTDPSMPDRAIAAANLERAQAMSKGSIDASPESLRTLREAFPVAVSTLRKPVEMLDVNALYTAYGVPRTQTAVNTPLAQFMAAELMMRAGANVVYMGLGGLLTWDTHADSSGARARSLMDQNVMPGLRVFLSRMMTAESSLSVTTTIFGEFARSLPGSDHASVSSTTVIGPKVKVGTTGKVSQTVSLPENTGGIQQQWAMLANAVKAPANPFGADPHNLTIS
jgi:hypothetical protein